MTAMIDKGMQVKEPCKGCSASVHVTDEQIRRMLAKLELKPFDCVSDAQYQERLKACGSCASLQYGTTCAHCGCFVQIRAKLRDKHCPLPGLSRW